MFPAPDVPPAHLNEPDLPPGYFDQLMELAQASTSRYVAPRSLCPSSDISRLSDADLALPGSPI